MISRDQQPVTCTWLYKTSVIQSICDTLLLRAVSAVLLLLKCLVSLFWQRPQGGRSPVEHTGTSICPSERADFRPERAWGELDEQTDRRTDKWKSQCVLQDFVPFWGRRTALLRLTPINSHTKQGNGYHWSHIAFGRPVYHCPCPSAHDLGLVSFFCNRHHSVRTNVREKWLQAKSMSVIGGVQLKVDSLEQGSTQGRMGAKVLGVAISSLCPNKF